MERGVGGGEAGMMAGQAGPWGSGEDFGSPARGCEQQRTRSASGVDCRSAG